MRRSILATALVAVFISYLGRDEIIYARTKVDQKRWRLADTRMIVKQLEKAEAAIVRLINTGQMDIVARLAELRRGPEEEEED